MAKKRKARRTIKKILVPTDFSDCSEEALSYAETLAKSLDAKIVLFHVIDTLSYAQWENVYPRLRASVGPFLETKVKKINKRGVAAACDLVQGFPYDQIVKKAQKIGADLIVMGTHGRTGMDHLLMGSVAERVTRLAPCPVLTVR
jgi:nucleotide-binding universal stress UspA family protein